MIFKPALTLEVAGDVVLNLVVARGAEKQSPVHQGELFEHGQRSVAQRTVDHVPLARTEGWQNKPTGRNMDDIFETTLLKGNYSFFFFFQTWALFWHILVFKGHKKFWNCSSISSQTAAATQATTAGK